MNSGSSTFNCDNIMKKTLLKLTMWPFLLAVVLTGCMNNQKPVSPVPSTPSAEDLIKRGEYLVTIMACNDCHSPKKTGPEGRELIKELMLSGYPAERPLATVNKTEIRNGWVMLNSDNTAAAGPWGVSFAANLTSDQSGIGNWTEENFRRAMKEGKFKGLEISRSLLPPMPWTNYRSIADEDVHAIFSYLMSTTPVSNLVPPPVNPEDIK
jgi:mono/diheme cytochrome c family protein